MKEEDEEVLKEGKGSIEDRSRPGNKKEGKERITKTIRNKF